MKPFIPQKLPIININWEKISTLLGLASSELGRYDGLLENMPNPEILLSPLTRKEAELSSKIEGTQSTMSEVLEYEAGEDMGDKRKIEEINVLRNYRWTLTSAEEDLKAGQEFSLSFLKRMHSMLMHNSRWDSSETPGDFRKKQVYIGSKGALIEEASYVPPEHFLIPEYMENWEQYLKNGTDEKMVKTAVMHAQFEIIHPFDDGNGRIGRMLITLYLYLSGALHRPMFYMSEYLEKNRTQYYEKLADISKNGNWQGWIEFFLTAVKEQTTKNIKKIRDINELYKIKSEEFKKSTKSHHYQNALNVFFKRPIVNSVTFMSKGSIDNPNTARNILKKLEKDKLIVKTKEGAGRSPSIYLFPDIINLVEEKKVF